MKTIKEIINEAIKVALSEPRSFSPGESVACENDMMTYSFVKEENGIVFCEWDGIKKEFPKEKVFNPNRVLKISLEIQAKQINAPIPNIMLTSRFQHN